MNTILITSFISNLIEIIMLGFCNKLYYRVHILIKSEIIENMREWIYNLFTNMYLNYYIFSFKLLSYNILYIAILLQLIKVFIYTI